MAVYGRSGKGESDSSEIWMGREDRILAKEYFVFFICYSRSLKFIRKISRKKRSAITLRKEVC